MSRPEILTDDVREYITKIKMANPQMKAKAVIEEVKTYLLNKFKDLGWDEDMVEDEKLAKGAIVKYLTRVNHELGKLSDLDNPWHLGLMSKPEYSITPEAVPYILMVQDWAEKNPTDLWKQPHEPLTIRQVLWVSRLYGIISPNLIATKKNFQNMLNSIAHHLYQWAESYATRERICELSGTPFNTKSLDKSLREGGEPITMGKTTISHYRDGSFSIDTVDKELKKQMEQMAKDGEQ